MGVGKFYLTNDTLPINGAWTESYVAVFLNFGTPFYISRMGDVRHYKFDI